MKTQNENITDREALENAYRRLNLNGHWFDADSIRFFKSKMSDSLIKTVNKKVYFVYSIKFDRYSPRLYKLNSLDLVTGRMDQLLDLGRNWTKREAKAEFDAIGREAKKVKYLIILESFEEAIEEVKAAGVKYTYIHDGQYDAKQFVKIVKKQHYTVASYNIRTKRFEIN